MDIIINAPFPGIGIIGLFAGYLMPSVYIYYFSIILSTLRLDFRLSSFNGLVAGFEYFIISYNFLNQSQHLNLPLPESFLGDQHHFAKSLMMVVSGVLAGFVAV